VRKSKPTAAGSSSTRLLLRVRGGHLLLLLALILFAVAAIAQPTCSKCGGELRISGLPLMGSSGKTWVIDHTRTVGRCAKCGSVEILEVVRESVER